MEIFGFMKKSTKLISILNCQAITTAMMIDSLSLHPSHSLTVTCKRRTTDRTNINRQKNSGQNANAS